MTDQTTPPSADTQPGPFSDEMTRASAMGHLRAAGWSVSTEADSVTIGFGAGPADRRPLSKVPADADMVDGHGLLRAAGFGALDLALARSVASDIPVDEVLVGLNWTMIRAGEMTGIARAPDRGTEGARTVRAGVPLAGRPLGELAGWLCSLDPLRRSVGLACVNAFWNRPEGRADGAPWGFARFDPPGEGLVIVGAFRKAAERLPAARVVEREPKGTDIPAESAPEALAAARAVAITAQTLMNGSLEPLLHHTAPCPRVMLVGPSAPVTPVLGGHGITESCGLAITDTQATASFIKETGTMIALDSQTTQLGWSI